ncbi:hypothetical protein FLAN108750_05390 [Flavobacterium antarcticum]|uniref:hypothetical protein n=1 Tax=Flavobacterium antarcticum TaxID=271155 RepID=UPI00041B33DD|nr:hypothetical protein [Flavobacterium antarcticum]
MEIKRTYAGKDVEMLITIDTIMENALKNQVFLQTKRSTWTPAFLEGIKSEIDTVVQTFIGKDNVKELRAATTILKGIQAPALNDLAELKVQIEADFAENTAGKNELLNTLGFKAYNNDAKKGDQEALISLLYQFKKNATTQVIQQITSKGTATQLITKITSYADALKNANVTQEVQKGSRKEATNEAKTAYNAIYQKVIPIAKIATNFYKDNQAIKEQFSYTKVKNNLNNNKKQQEPKP